MQDPLIIAGAEGNYLIDDRGNRYFDGVSSLWVLVHGHRKREIDEGQGAGLASLSDSMYEAQHDEPAGGVKY